MGSGDGETPRTGPTSPIALRFVREARVTGQLEHPSIVPVYELGRHADGTIYYTMKYVRGRTLHDAIHACETVAERLRLLPHVTDLCHAVAYAHSRGVINRDIKPHNIMVGEFGETVVLDWGLSKVLGEDDLRAREIVRDISMLDDVAEGQTAVQFLGTPNYMPPEQAWGKLDEVDERSDVWAIGAVLYEVLTGHPPFEGHHGLHTVMRVRQEKVAPALEREPAAPSELCAIAMRCLRRKSAHRYESAGEVADELERYHSGARVAAYEYGSWELLKRFVAKNRAISAAAATAILVLAISTVFIYQQYTVAVESEQKAIESETETRLAMVRVEESREEARTAAMRARRSELEAKAARDDARDKAREALQASELAETRRLQAEAEKNRARRAEDEARLTLAEAFMEKCRAAADENLHDRAATFAAETLKIRERPDARGKVLSIVAGREFPHLVGALAAGTGGLRHLDVAPDGGSLAGGDAHGRIYVWDLETGMERVRMDGHAGEITGLSYAPQAGLVATAATDRTIAVFRLDDQQEVLRLEGHRDAVLALALSADGRILAAGNATQSITIWEVPSGVEKLRLRGFGGALRSLAFSPDGSLVLAGGGDRTLRLWESSGGPPWSGMAMMA